MLGLDGAGKTSIHRRLLHAPSTAAAPEPTIGFTVENMVHNRIELEVWDVGGQVSACQSSPFYSPNGRCEAEGCLATGSASRALAPLFS